MRLLRVYDQKHQHRCHLQLVFSLRSNENISGTKQLHSKINSVNVLSKSAAKQLYFVHKALQILAEIPRLQIQH